MSTTAPLYLNVAGAAAYLGVTERFMRRLVTERRITFHRIGRNVRFKTTDLDAFAEQGKVEALR